MTVLSSLGRRLRPSVVTGLIPSRPFTQAASHPSSAVQVYRLTSSDPLVNLSIEHHLLQNTPPDSTILLLYVNAPCVVFGRNQNPWLEVNLPRLAQIRDKPHEAGWSAPEQPVRLVRRRSGGGTVFHDEGNVNFSVICPPAVFDRDRHAEMVVRALASLGRSNTRVNERHDIVMDHEESGGTFKISGSAYKLTRLRSLHHGTCLLQSPHLGGISGMLRSPAEGFIKARGVDSVRSPVRNVQVDVAKFQDAVVGEFDSMYGRPDVVADVGHEALETASIRKGYDELQSRDWIYGQTPRFTLSTHPTEEDPRQRPTLPFTAKLHLEARHGVIEHANLSDVPMRTDPAAVAAALHKVAIHDVDDWRVKLDQAGVAPSAAGDIGGWMNAVLGTGFTARHLLS